MTIIICAFPKQLVIWFSNMHTYYICREWISNNPKWMVFHVHFCLLNRPFKWGVLQLMHFLNSPKGTATFFICDDISCIHVFTFPRNIEVSILKYYIFRVRRTLIKKVLILEVRMDQHGYWTSYTQGDRKSYFIFTLDLEVKIGFPWQIWHLKKKD